MMRGVAAMIGVAALAACARVDDQALAGLKPGQTTVEQTIRALGSPDRDEALSDGSRMLTYVQTSARPYPVNFVPLANNVWGGWYGAQEEAGLMFGADGYLRFWAWSTDASRTIKLVGRDAVPHAASDLMGHGTDSPSLDGGRDGPVPDAAAN